MVTTGELRDLWEYYDDQSRLPFIGSIQAKKFATRLKALVDAKNKNLLMRRLPKEASTVMSMIRKLSEKDFNLLIMTGKMPRDDEPVAPIPEPEPVCDIPDEEMIKPPVVTTEFDKREARWIVYIGFQHVLKRVAEYVYKEQARAIVKAVSRNNDKQLKELWNAL